MPLPAPDVPENFASMFDCSGERFTGAIPPPDVLPGAQVASRLRADGWPPFAPPGSRMASPIYGVVSQAGPDSCHGFGGGGLVEDGEQLDVWLVVWPEVSGGNGGQAFALVDARTGSFVVGDGPPGP